nr:PREDICTED: F-box/LRR-repeat protein 2-like isoform X1 [Latimeria chalumnae]|eukprot:XP_006001237.1 PREDICTED: F-box/LRR-repeat protein 2-like isoform X1 [Latimeria chalumnae]
MDSPELPVEMIKYILSFLSVSDRKEAALVNQAWYVASQDYQFQKDVMYSIPASASLETLKRFGRRPQSCVVLNNLDGSALSKDIIKNIALHLGPHLKSLSIHGSSITESSFMFLIPHCQSLEKLDLSGCNSLFMSGILLAKADSVLRVKEGLANVQELNLSSLRYLSDLTFNRLTDCTPNLKRLALAGCHITFKFDPYHGSNVCNSTAVLSLRNILRFLRSQVQSLRSLDFSRTGITPDALRSVVQVEGFRLEELVLQNCKDLSDDAISALCNCQPGLVTLDLRSCSELSDRAVASISSSLKNLQHLYLGNMRRVTDSSLKGLPELPHLQVLDLSHCYQVAGKELLKGLSSPHIQTKMRSLNFSCCSLVKDTTVLSLARLLGSRLHTLDLSSCVYITDNSIQAIASYLSNLKVLRLGWCKEITDWGLLGMETPSEEHDPSREKDEKGPKFSRTFGNLGFFTPPKYLEDKPCLLTEAEMEDLKARRGPSVRALTSLRELDLTACTKLTDISITKVIQFAALKKLSLSMVTEVTDVSLRSVAEHCRSLEQLSLSHCCNLTNDGLTEAAKCLRRLAHLDVSCCDKITDQALEVIAVECKGLKSLDVSMCDGITMLGVELVQLKIPSLTSIQTRFVGGADLSFTL